MFYRASAQANLTAAFYPYSAPIIVPQSWSRMFSTASNLENNSRTQLSSLTLMGSINPAARSAQTRYSVFVVSPKAVSQSSVVGGALALTVDLDYTTPSGLMDKVMMNPKRWKVHMCRRYVTGVSQNIIEPLPLESTQYHRFYWRLKRSMILRNDETTSTATVSWKDMPYPRKLSDQRFLLVFSDLPMGSDTNYATIDYTVYAKVKSL